MTDLTHERCSELLEAYASEGLPDREQNEVAAHLGSCSGCSTELRGLLALRATEIVPMTGPERDALTAAVRAAVIGTPKKGLAEWLGRRMAPALGAVALVVLGVVGYVSVSDDAPLPSTQQGADEAQVETLEEGADTDAAAPAAEPYGDSKKEAGLTQDSGGSGTATGAGGTESSADMTTAAGAPQAATLRAPAGLEVRDSLFADSGLDLGSLIPNRMPPRRIADRLAATAPNERLAQMVRDCAELTVSTSPYPLVPSSAAYYADDVLVIGFVWLDERTGTLNYELRGWLGGSCDRVTPIYRRGLIE